ncbi:MAG: bifunctional lysine-specific demethylase and histidyl-hydroxylase [Pseudonocardiales bacterium]|jgi:hypothetical protein|nr:bifunctional lysine-specific demethylase and histidyl-hydroxylase [Pseudonocardiales bacterium]
MMAKESALERLVGDTSEFESTLPTRPLLFTRPESPIKDIVSFAVLDHLIASMPLKPPFLEIFKDNERIDYKYYQYGRDANDVLMADWINPVAAAEFLEQGATFIFALLDRTIPGVATFCRSLSTALGLPISADAFLTPKYSQSLDRHYDRVSSFIVQVEGEKYWELWSPTAPGPLSDYHPWMPTELEDSEHDRLFSNEPTLKYKLTPGSVLWLPRGWVHNVHTEEEPSLHLTFGIPDITGHTVARVVLDMLADVPELREDLPLHFWERPSTMQETLARSVETMIDAIHTLDRAQLAGLVANKMLTQMLPADLRTVSAGVGRLPQATKAELLTDQIVHLESADDELTLHLGNRDVTVSGAGKEAVEHALDSGTNVIDATQNPDLIELIDALWHQGVARVIT